MKRLLLILIFSFIFSKVYCQDTITKNGYVTLKFDNGKIASEGTMRDGLPDGYWKSYNNKGILISEGNRKDFMLDSLWKFYNDAGVLFMTVNFKNGKKNGIKISYLADEKIEETYKDNIKVNFENHFSLQGKLLKTIPFEEGLEEGLAKEFDENGNIISLIEYKKGYSVRREYINRKDQFGLKQGTWKIFYDHDILHFEINYLNNKKHGICKEFDIEGNLIKIEKYDNDILVENAIETRILDTRIDYYENGNPKIIGTYFNGIAEGTRREYNDKGEVIQSYIIKSGYILAQGILDDNGLRQGSWEEYYDEKFALSNQKLIRAKGKYKNSKPVGEWKYFFPNGKVEIEGVYNANGKKEGTWTWYYQNGEILIQDNYEDGKHEGLYVEYDENKNIIVKGNFVEGKEDGKWFRANKDFIEEGKYVDGKREGLWKGYYKNGNVCYECHFNSDNFDGRYIRNWENGRVKEQGSYVLGLKNGSWRKFDEQGNIYLIVTYKKGVEIRFEGVKIDPVLEDSDLPSEE